MMTVQYKQRLGNIYDWKTLEHMLVVQTAAAVLVFRSASLRSLPLLPLNTLLFFNKVSFKVFGVDWFPLLCPEAFLHCLLHHHVR